MEDQFNVGTRINHANYGEGIISKNDTLTFRAIFVRGGELEFSKLKADFEVIEPSIIEDNQPKVDLREVEKMLSHVLDRYNAIQYTVELGKKWVGGTMSLQPFNPDLKPKEISIDAFFHKIVMMRDRLRVLEQNINSHKSLTDEEKVNLQQYITRCYGSMTTFNILFDEKEDYFVGSKN